MSIWSFGALVYVVARTVIAAVLLVLALRKRTPGILAAQAMSDAAVALLITAYALHPLRAALGWLSVPLFLYFCAWEGLAAAQRLSAIGEIATAPLSDAELFGGMSHWVWDLGGLAPAFIMGVLVAGAIIMPGEWTLPGAPSALSCSPVELASGDALVLRMKTPHGAELGVFTPRRGYLSLRPPFAARTAPEVGHLEHQPRFDVPTDSATGWRRLATADEPVFVDVGTYTFSMSAYKDPSRAFTCVVRYQP